MTRLQNRTSPGRTALLTGLVLALLTTACTSEDSPPDSEKSSSAIPSDAEIVMSGGEADAGEDAELLGALAQRSKVGADLPLDRSSAVAAEHALVPPAAANQDVGFAFRDDAAAFTWEVNDRQEQWSLRWGVLRTVDVETPIPHTQQIRGYSPEYVHPDHYALDLDGCESESTDGTPIETFTWRLEFDGAEIDSTTRPDCTHRVLIPEEGVYRVTLRTTTEAGHQSTVEGNINVQDILVVSIGDSSASGEGNPTGNVRGGRWVDRRCHRSTQSGHTLAALALEEASRQSTVTYLPFGCSGADLENGLLGPYDGMDPTKYYVPGNLGASWTETPLVPQVDAMREALCKVPVEECTNQDVRRPDLVLVATGVNDLAFSDVLTLCAGLDLGLLDVVLLPITIIRKIFRESCNESDELDDALGNALLSIDSLYEDILADLIPCDLTDEQWRNRLGFVPEQEPYFCYEDANTYGEIRRQLASDGTLPTGGIYMTTYPVDVFSRQNDTKGGCGIFIGVDSGEAAFIRDKGLELNELIQADAVRNGAFSVPDIVARFHNHGYCAGPLDAFDDGAGFDAQNVYGSESYFVPLNESLVKQANLYGTVHPNLRGHQAISHAILDAINRPKPPRSADYEAELTITRVRYFDLPVVYRYSSDLLVSVRPREPMGYNDAVSSGQLEPVLWKSATAEREEFPVPTSGEWVTLPEPIRVKVRLSPADSSVTVWIRTELKAEGNFALARPIEPPGWNPGDEVIPADDGVLGFFKIEFQPQRSATPAYGDNPTLVRAISDQVGGQLGRLSVEYCYRVRKLEPGVVQPDLTAPCEPARD